MTDSNLRFPNFFPKPDDVRYTTNLRCICGLKECRNITKSFRDLNDIRGQLKVFPNPREESRKGNITKMNMRFKNRAITHFHDLKEGIENQCNIKPAQITRANQAQKKSVFIAQWHFDKKLFQRKEDNASILQNGGTLPNSIPLVDGKHLDVFHWSGGNVYSNPDVYEHEVKVNNKGAKEKKLLLVPTVYDTKSIKIDIENAKQSKAVYDASRRAVASTQRQIATLGKRRAVTPPINQLNSSAKKPRYLSIDDFMHLDDELKRKHVQGLHNQLQNAQKEIEEQKNVIETKQAAIESLSLALKRHQELSQRSFENSGTREEALQKNEKLLEAQLNALREFGLNRISLSSKEFYVENDKLCRSLYGCDDFEFLVEFVESMFDITYEEPKEPKISQGGDMRNTANRQLSDVEQVLLTMLWSNTMWNHDLIGLIFGVRSRKTVGDYVNFWMPRLGEVGDMLSSFLPYLDGDALDALEPESYEGMGLHKVVAALVDGKDFDTETVRADRVLNCAQASNKTHGSAFRLLTWSLPCGIVVERTPAFFGRASEKSIMRTWGGLGRLIFPIGYCILGDKGFDNTAGCYANYNTTLHPAFLTNEQFSRGEVNHNMKICQKRYSCEVVYSRVTDTEKLSGTYRREWFHHFEPIVGWAHGKANLFYAFLQPPVEMIDLNDE